MNTRIQGFPINRRHSLKRFISVMIPLVALLPAALRAQSSRYTFSEVWPPFGQYDRVEATAINDAGDVCGTVAEYPFLFTEDVMYQLPTLGGTFNKPFAINNHGEMVGHAYRLDLTSEAVIWRPDLSMEILRIDGPGYEGHPYPTDISDSGIIVGKVNASYPHERGWAYYQGTTYDLGTIRLSVVNPHAVNESGVVVGDLQRWVDSEGDERGINRGFIWRLNTGMKRVEIPYDDTQVGINDVNDAAEMAGESGYYSAIFARSRDDVSSIGEIRLDTSYASAINNAGQIVGSSGSFRSFGPRNPTLYEKGLLYDLTELLDDDPDADLEKAIDISDTGLILCTERVGLGDPMKAFVLHPQANDELRFVSFVPALAGEVNTLEISGATPDEMVYLVLAAPTISQVCSEPVPGCPGITVPFCQPQLVGKQRADAEGQVRWARMISSAAADQLFWIQALELSSCRTTVPAAIVIAGNS